MREDITLFEAWNRQLYRWWNHFNVLYLRNALQTPVLRLSHAETPWGNWDAKLRTITLSALHIGREPWEEVLNTLRHEMAHQFVEEVLKVRDEPPHGPAFRQACERLRCETFSTTAQRENEEEDRLLRVLKKVMSLASSPNEHEAQAAMQKGQELLLKHNIDLTRLNQERHYFCRTLGEIKGRRTSSELWMASLLSRFFFVEVLWKGSYDARRNREGSVLEIMGTHQNLDMAEYVHGFLQRVLKSLWLEYKKDKGIASDRDRQRFGVGVLEGFYRKLEEQEASLQTSRALVWKGDARLKAYVRHLYPRTRTQRGRGITMTDAYEDGLHKGRQLTLHKPVEAKGTELRYLSGQES